MKANHNTYLKPSLLSHVVVNISKIQNESKSQQVMTSVHTRGCCCQYFKDTK